MSKLVDFLSLKDVSELTEEIYINERIGGFTVRPMSSAQLKAHTSRSKNPKTGEVVDVDFNLNIIVGQISEPDLSNSEFLGKAKCSTSREFITKKFKSGEIATIAKKIMEASGFDMGKELIEAYVEDAQD